MSVAAVTWALSQHVGSSPSKFVLVVLADCADKESGIAFPSIAYIAEATDQDVKTVGRALDRLQAGGWITDTGTRRGRTKQIVVYRLNTTRNGGVPELDENDTAKSEQPNFVDYSMKGDFLRVDITTAKGQHLSSIWDLNKHEMTTLMPEQKMYMVMKTEDLAAAAQNAAPKVQIEKTGETEKILGYTATKYLVTDTERKTTTDVWAAEGLGTFMMGRSSPFAKNGGMSPVEKELAARGFFPLRMVSHDASGAEVFRMEAVSIDKKSLSDDLFAPPADYHRFDMGGLFGGFGGKPQN